MCRGFNSLSSHHRSCLVSHAIPVNSLAANGSMKTLHFYLLRQVIASLLLTVAVFTFVLLLGNVLKEVLVLLVSGRASFWMVAKSIGLLIPFVWVFALPMGMLTATLLTFGRFSADQELTATRASGISLISLITPILLLSVLLSALSAWVTMDLGPRSRVAYKSLLHEAVLRLATEQLPAGRYIKDFKDYIFYIGENNEGEMRDVMVFVVQDQTNIASTVQAPRARLTADSVNSIITLELFNAKSVIMREDGSYVGPSGNWSIKLPVPKIQDEEISISDMTFWQLRQELQDVRAQVRSASREPDETAGPEVKEAALALDRMEAELTLPLRIQLNRQMSFSFACIGFTLIGIPLGIQVHRRETNIGIAIGLALVLVYYSFFILGQSLEMDPQYRPHLILWIPNFLFQILGGILLWRANRRG